MRLLLISGSTRTGSVNSAVVRTAATLLGREHDALLWTGLADLPAFNPDDDGDPLPAAVIELRRAARAGAARAGGGPIKG